MRRYIAIGIGIFLIIGTFVWVLASRGSRPQQDADLKRPSSLVDQSNSATVVRFTQEGKINARENHRVLQIEVGQNQRTATIFYGYEGNILRQQNLINDPDAFQALLAALQNSGYTRSRVATRGVDPLGACPTGYRYHYDILEAGAVKQSLWSTSCGNVRGTFAGQANTVRTLFQAQLPDYNTFIEGVQF